MRTFEASTDTANPVLTSDCVKTAKALQKSVEALVSHQAENGAWEGEIVWCAMLPAQYVLMHHIMRKPIPPAQQKAILKQFLSTQLPNGLWGLHEHSDPYLFVTTLVYVAARLLGVDQEDSLISPAKAFIQAEGGAVAIPSWGKFWLAMLNLYDWQGVSPILPEAWGLPKQFFCHPKYYYCHTRLIYMGMAYVFSQKFKAPLTPLLSDLRSELYPQGYDAVDFSKARNQLRAKEIYSPHSFILKGVYRLATVYDRWHLPGWRAKILSELIAQIRFEFQSTQYTCVSPVSGLLNLIALWLHNPQDKDLEKGLEGFQMWLWQDADTGLSIAGARSETWDTSFALQALRAAAPHVKAFAPRRKAHAFLRRQQISALPMPELPVPELPVPELPISALPVPENELNYETAHRIDPDGGFCVAGVWHGWPVSDCTAEALLALMETSPPLTDLTRAMSFILRCQNQDGGFGSYERRRIASTLEWLNPSEMFCNSMTEQSYVECTASCLSALQEFSQHYPEEMANQIISAMDRASQWLEDQQRPDGSWPGFWGVNFIYGTMFGVRGMLAAGLSYESPVIQRACEWMIGAQQPDGGWGEDFRGLLCDRYRPHTESQIIHTAWALIALLEANAPQWQAIERGAMFLASQQQPNGEWLKQDPAGVFFQTALLDYTLYRAYFPVWALGLYETQRKQRLSRKLSPEFN